VKDDAVYVRRTLKEFVRLASSVEDDRSAVLRGVAEEMEGMGLTAEVEEDLGVVSARRGRGGVLFNGHLDTVPLGLGWTRKQGEVAGNRLYGRGAADMKGGCVAALAAARRLVKDDIPFGLLFTTDEETTMRGAKAMAKRALVRKAAAVVVGEPTGLRIVTAEKGVLWFRLTIKGRGAHGSLPHRGVNAILKAARVLLALEPLTRPKAVHDEVTASVGVIAGGTQTNVVADRCTVDLDFRYPATVAQDDVTRVLRAKLREARVEADVVLRHFVPAAATDPRGRHVRRLRALSGARTTRVTYATEMAWFATTNPRCVVFGPGNPTRIHTPDEWVDLREVTRCADVYARYAEVLAP
jgi:acetylornithine deacetylase/succinyl-diaminopimelate desuccinylase-like protein